MSHISVLLKETIDGLAIRSGEILVDCTLGDAGHAKEAIRRHQDLTLVGIDRDQSAILRAGELLGKSDRIILRQGNFRDLEKTLDDLGIDQVDRVILDVGLSSRQLEESGRGFSFQRDEPLIMTFEVDGGLITAETVVNEWSQENLAQIIFGFGEEKYARKIAKGIVEARESAKITTTGRLVEVILSSTPRSYHHGKIHPATRTFQAIRIAVNDELGALEEGLSSAWKRLAPTGRIAVISFHSLEDRIVKTYFNKLKDQNLARLINKKPITATEIEIAENPRSRSAKLRIIEKI